MEELFDKLKAEPPVLKSSKLNTELNSSPRRESLPSPKPIVQHTPGKNKCRSLSPSATKSFKVLIDRKRIKDCFPNETDATNITPNELCAQTPSPIVGSSKRQMPTKAQQKLFEPSLLASLKPAISDDEVKCKTCKVRIRREDLPKLQEEFKKNFQNSPPNKKAKKTPVKKEVIKTPTSLKRKSTSEEEETTPTTVNQKRSRKSKETTVSPPSTSGFFIKLNTSPNSAKKSPANKQKSPKVNKERTPRKSTSPHTVSKAAKSPANPTSVTKAKLAVSSSSSPVTKAATSAATTVAVYPVLVTKATKFTRTQLINCFGKRYFNAYIKIERCKHPLMLAFEEEARAHKRLSKNKSKNLSVSFREQVEIFGTSDTESNDSEGTNKIASKNKQPLDSIPTPDLAKVANGKISNLEALPFDGGNIIDSSTPLRKKPEKKTYSPLKDDSTSSERNELLKLADEKIPPKGLRNLENQVVEEFDEDEDEECEYIVPIEIPKRRLSNTETVTVDLDETEAKADYPTIVLQDVAPSKNSIDIANEEEKDRKELSPPKDSSSSFESAIDQPVEDIAPNKKVIDEQKPPSPAVEVLQVITEEKQNGKKEEDSPKRNADMEVGNSENNKEDIIDKTGETLNLIFDDSNTDAPQPILNLDEENNEPNKNTNDELKKDDILEKIVKDIECITGKSETPTAISCVAES